MITDPRIKVNPKLNCIDAICRIGRADVVSTHYAPIVSKSGRVLVSSTFCGAAVRLDGTTVTLSDSVAQRIWLEVVELCNRM
jgi:hypothetical protein